MTHYTPHPSLARRISLLLFSFPATVQVNDDNPEVGARPGLCATASIVFLVDVAVCLSVCGSSRFRMRYCIVPLSILHRTPPSPTCLCSVRFRHGLTGNITVAVSPQTILAAYCCPSDSKVRRRPRSDCIVCFFNRYYQ